MITINLESLEANIKKGKRPPNALEQVLKHAVKKTETHATVPMQAWNQIKRGSYTKHTDPLDTYRPTN